MKNIGFQRLRSPHSSPLAWVTQVTTETHHHLPHIPCFYSPHKVRDPKREFQSVQLLLDSASVSDYHSHLANVNEELIIILFQTIRP